MSGAGIIVIIVIAAIIVVAAVVGIAYLGRQRQLRQRFGPEYDRVVEEHHSRRKAEAELTERERRVRGLDIRPLDPEAQDRHLQEWAALQEQFVDAPQLTVADAQTLVVTVMNERGYPTEQDGQMLADLSVDHANVLDHYRAASAISQRAAGGSASTEDLRQALIHYRALFQDLLGDAREPGQAADTAQPPAPETPAPQTPAPQTPAARTAEPSADVRDEAAPTDLQQDSDIQQDGAARRAS
jgi:hypothetical protein